MNHDAKIELATGCLDQALGNLEDVKQQLYERPGSFDDESKMIWTAAEQEIRRAMGLIAELKDGAP